MRLRVHENAQLIFACMLVSHGEIASKPRLPEVTVHCISARFERDSERCHDGVAGVDGCERLPRERIQFLENSSCLGDIPVRGGLGVLQEVLESVRAVIVVVGDLIVADRADDDHMMPVREKMTFSLFSPPR